MNQFKRCVDNRWNSLTLPKLEVKRAIHVLYILAVAHHGKIAIFALYG